LSYALPDLPCDYSALEPHISGQIVELHHDKHHHTYVQDANATLEKLAAARASDDFGAIVGLEKTLVFDVSGHVLHSIYWQNMTPGGGGEPGRDLADALRSEFKSFAAFKAQLTHATTSVQGSGWGALAWDPLGRRLLTEQVYDHQGNIGQGAVPLLMIDIWEHAFYLQYKNVKADYVSGFWNPLNWPDVAQRLDAARSANTLAVSMR
jgi:Fe-Mn family superoxide dismutase